MPKDPLSRAWEQSEKADLGLVIGSSMTVGGFMGLPGLSAFLFNSNCSSCCDVNSRVLCCRKNKGVRVGELAEDGI